MNINRKLYRNHILKNRKRQTIVSFLGVVVIPLCVAFVLNIQNKRQQEKDLRTKYVEIAANILATPSTNEELREWATTTLDSFAEIKLPSKVKKDLNKGRNLYGPATIIGAPVKFLFKQIKISKSYTGETIGVRAYLMSGSVLYKQLIFEQVVKLQVDPHAIDLKKSIDFSLKQFSTNQSETANIHLFEELYNPETGQIVSSKQSLITPKWISDQDVNSNLSGKHSGLSIWSLKVDLKKRH